MLQIENLTKIYKGSKKPALDNVSFTIQEGEFVALLGQNGAGKSTLINILGGNVKKTSGKVLIGGYDLDTHELETKKNIGIVPQEISFDYIFSVEEILKNQSGYFGLKDNRAYINQLLEALALENKKTSNSFQLSGGMKRRLLIAKAMIHRPKLLILDEPTAGVDIELRHSLYGYLQKLHKEGTTIILTTHYLEEAEKLCDRIIVIGSGNLMVDESKEALMGRLGSEAMLEFSFNTPVTSADFNFLSGYSPVVEDNSKLKLQVYQHNIGEVFQKMSLSNMNYSSFKVEPKKLEDVFLQLITD